MNTTPLRVALPKGRMQEGVFGLLKDAGLPVRVPSRGYRPKLPLEGADTKLLKPQNIIEMLAAGSRDVGFAGADWVAELDADVVDLLDLGLDPVRLVVAAPREILEDGRLPNRRVRIASEYQRLSQDWIKLSGLDATFIRTYGATEVFPPDDADAIIDITQSGATLEANGLVIVDELARSSSRLLASRAAAADPAKRERIDDLVVLITAVLEARKRALLELNVLHSEGGYAVRAAVPRKDLPKLIPAIKAAGGSDLVVSSATQIVP